MTKNTLLQIEYFLMHFLHWAVYAIPAGFSSTYLLSIGYSNSSIGIVTALFAFISFVLQPILADKVDRAKKNILMLLLSAMSAIILACFIALSILPPSFLTIVIYVVIGSLFYSFQPLVNSVVAKAEEGGFKIQYGPCRAGGSLGYAITCSLLGTMAVKYGTNIIMVTGIVLIGLFLLDVMLVQKMLGNIENQQKNDDEPDIPFMAFMKRHKIYVYLCIAIVLVFYSNAITSTYMLQIVTRIGGDSSDMGKMLGYMATFEIVPMVLSPWLMKKMSKKVLAIISAWCFVLKILVIALCPTIKSLTLAQALQMPGFPLMMPVMVALTSDLLKGKEAVRGQALFIMAITMGNILASVTGGVLIDMFSITTLLYLSIAITAIGAALFSFIIKTDNSRF